MSEMITPFKSRGEKDARVNLADFIDHCREKLTVFGPSLNWSGRKWPGVHFSKLGARRKHSVDDDQLDEQFIAFGKAYLRYQQGLRPRGAIKGLKAIKLIEAALLRLYKNADPSIINGSVLDEAARLASSHYGAVTAYHAGRELEKLATFVTDNKLIRSFAGDWRSPIKRPKDDTIQTGKEALARQARKLPMQEAIDAIAEIFANEPTDLKDIFTSSTFAVCMCAPSRASEVLDLTADLEVEERDAKGVLRYGWRFYSAKGFEGDVKWIVSEMVPVAKEAVRRIRNMTEHARRLARWMEENPGRFYRHASCPDVADDTPLTTDQACRALGVLSLSNAGLSRREGAHTLNSLWAWVMERQPENFPWLNREKKVRYSNSLFCMTANLMHAGRGKSPVILWAPTTSVFNSYLSPRESLGDVSYESIFERYGYRDKNGNKLKVTSHQIRHLLNTIAQRGKVAQELIAKWSGRADIKQNRVYNHRNEFEMVAEAQALDPTLSLFGPVGDCVGHAPICVEDLELMERGPVHITEFGVCIHDYTMSPCERFRDCINCEEQVCIKGDGVKEARIRFLLESAETDFSATNEAALNGYSGADRWFEYQEKNLRRLRQLVAILDDPEVPDGALIKLIDGGDFSHLKRAIDSRIGAELKGNKSVRFSNLFNSTRALVRDGKTP